mmetsp:Transcript_9853/g.20448  ORF Transcript_9853/g.20448 Transcript_9853/m.20448 type:complete len:124 (-) Transcript_9853:475-846(-)
MVRQGKHRRRLKKSKPAIPRSKPHHCHDLSHPKKLPIHNPLIRQMLHYKRHRRKEKAQEIRQNENPFDFPVVNFSCSPYHDSLGKNQRAVEAGEDSRDAEFSGAFHGEEEHGGGGVNVTYGAN